MSSTGSTNRFQIITPKSDNALLAKGSALEAVLARHQILLWKLTPVQRCCLLRYTSNGLHGMISIQIGCKLPTALWKTTVFCNLTTKWEFSNGDVNMGWSPWWCRLFPFSAVDIDTRNLSFKDCPQSCVTPGKLPEFLFSTASHDSTSYVMPCYATRSRTWTEWLIYTEKLC